MLTLLRVMVSCRTLVPFNGPFSSNLSASGFDVINCGPSPTAICPLCNWWPLLAASHSALFSWPDMNQEASTQQYHVVFYIPLHQPSLHFLIIPQHLKKTQCRQWSRGGISHSVTAYQPRFTSTSSLTHHWCKQENRLLTYQHWKLMNCSVSCVTWTFTMAVTLLSVSAQAASSIIFNCQMAVLSPSKAAEEYV